MSRLADQEVVSPGSHAEFAAALRELAADGAAVRFRGAGTKAHWGAAGRAPDAVLGTSGLDRIVEHNEGDLTAVVDAGVALVDLQEAVAGAGQMLALDPPDGGATIGGVVATADSGPLRHRYGSVRDLVVGMTVALSDGTVARSGGKVIKNVAGYDLAKLFAGAYGTLGAILGVAVRLHPLPPRTATAVGTSDDPGVVAAAAAAMAHARVEIQSLDTRWEHGTGTVLARAGGAAATDPAGEMCAVLAEHGLQARVEEDDAALWDAQRAAQRSGDGIVVRVSGLQAQAATLLDVARDMDARVVSRVAFGLSWITVEKPTDVDALRRTLSPSPCVVLDAPPAQREALDVWGPQDSGAVALMQRVRARFDPPGACAPGVLEGMV